MNIVDEIFKKTTVNEKNLIKYGFKKDKKGYYLEQKFFNDSFLAQISINLDGEISGKVIDLEAEEEYLPIYLEESSRKFCWKCKGRI